MRYVRYLENVHIVFLLCSGPLPDWEITRLNYLTVEPTEVMIYFTDFYITDHTISHHHSNTSSYFLWFILNIRKFFESRPRTILKLTVLPTMRKNIFLWRNVNETPVVFKFRIIVLIHVWLCNCLLFKFASFVRSKYVLVLLFIRWIIFCRSSYLCFFRILKTSDLKED